MLARFVLFLPSAFCGATVFVNGAFSHDFDAFARREREGWQIWILHLTASVVLAALRRQLKSANTLHQEMFCALGLQSRNEDENLNTFFLRALFYECDISLKV